MHAMKIKMGGVGHMMKHYRRDKDEHGEYIKIGNQDIDFERTHMNYNLCSHDYSYKDMFRVIADENVRYQNRRDVNLLVDWVVTAPQELPPAEVEGFFEGIYDMFCERYFGFMPYEQRDMFIQSAYVHMDETNPHMHFSFMPVFWDEDKERYRLSAANVINRSELRAIHGEFDLEIKNRGYIVDLLNEATKEGNKSIAELKRKSADARLAEVMRETQSIRSELAEKEHLLDQREKFLDNREKQLDKAVRALDEHVASNDAREQALYKAVKAVDELQVNMNELCTEMSDKIDTLQSMLHELGGQRNAALDKYKADVKVEVDQVKNEVKSLGQWLDVAKAEKQKQNKLRQILPKKKKDLHEWER